MALYKKQKITSTIKLVASANDRELVRAVCPLGPCKQGQVSQAHVLGLGLQAAPKSAPRGPQGLGGHAVDSQTNSAGSHDESQPTYGSGPGRDCIVPGKPCPSKTQG